MADKETKKNINPPNFNPQKKNKPKFSFYWIYGILALGFIGIQYFNYSNPVKEIAWIRLETMLEKQDVEKIVIINKEKAEIYIKKEKLQSDTAYKEFIKKSFSSSLSNNPQYVYQIGSEEIFNGLMKDKRDSIVVRMSREGKPVNLINSFTKQYPYPPSHDSRKDIFGDIFS